MYNALTDTESLCAELHDTLYDIEQRFNSSYSIAMEPYYIYQQVGTMKVLLDDELDKNSILMAAGLESVTSGLEECRVVLKKTISLLEASHPIESPDEEGKSEEVKQEVKAYHKILLQLRKSMGVAISLANLYVLVLLFLCSFGVWGWLVVLFG